MRKIDFKKIGLVAFKALAARNGGTPIPAYAFQHIIVPDIYDAMDIVPSSEKKNGAVEGYGCRKGTYYSAASVIEAGTLGEAPCPPAVNSPRGSRAAISSRASSATTM